MSKKWTNEQLSGALHYVTGNVDKRRHIFAAESNCIAFLEELQSLKNKLESKLICFVIMPDHFHLVVNPRGGDIQAWIRALKSITAKRLVRANPIGCSKRPAARIKCGKRVSRALLFGAAG